MTSVSVSLPLASAFGTMHAHTTSPYILSGTPKETASPTPGTDSRAESTSRGEIFSPPITWGKVSCQSVFCNDMYSRKIFTTVDELLDTTCKDKMSILVKLALIARTEPAIGSEGLLVGFLLQVGMRVSTGRT